MAAGLPPPPLNSPNGSYYWLEWYTQLTNAINQVGYPFTNLSFTGSDIVSIETRNHNELTTIQGGTATMTTPGGGNAWHMEGVAYVSATGTVVGMPSGWTFNHSGTGTYTFTTGLSTAVGSFGAVATSNSNGFSVDWIDVSGVGSIVVHTVSRNTATPANCAFTLIVSV